MKDIGQEPEFSAGTYRHYKGGIYNALGLACNSETLEWYVIYQSVERSQKGLPSVWIRPYDMFVENIEINGEMKPRFEKLKDSV